MIGVKQLALVLSLIGSAAVTRRSHESAGEYVPRGRPPRMQVELLSRFTAIGALNGATLAWFDSQRKMYRTIPIKGQVEMISMIGDIALCRSDRDEKAIGSGDRSDADRSGSALIAWQRKCSAV